MAIAKELTTDSSKSFVSMDKWHTKGGATLEDTIRKRFIAYLAGGDSDSKNQADKMLKQIGVKNGIDGISFSGSNVTDGLLTIKLTYTQEYFIDLKGLAAWEHTMTVAIKMWGLK